MPGTNEKYKDRHPMQTIGRIRNILKELDVILLEQWLHEVDGCYSLNLVIYNTPMFSNGKGTTPEYALASAMGELLERMQNFQLKGLRMYLIPELLKYGGFFFAPDEKLMSINEYLESGGYLLERYTFGAASAEEKQAVLDKWLIETSIGKPSHFYSLPFLKISDGSICYIPEIMLQMFYGSNGMCAGNTKEEALVQGISEVLERYAKLRIIQERLTPPDIPADYLEKFPTVCGMIKNIEEKGNYRITAKDCSLGESLPVAGIILSDLDANSYMVVMGAHPHMEIALERCLTEALQGRKLGNKSWMTEYSYLDKKADSQNNIHTLLITGEGSFPTEFFGNDFSYEFTEPESSYKYDNKSMLEYLICLLKKRKNEIYIRDVSFLGFTSFQIIIDGMSECISPVKSAGDLEKSCRFADRTAKRLNEATVDELEQFIGYIKEALTPERTLADILRSPEINTPIKISFPWSNIKRDFLISGIYCRLGKLRQAYDAMDDFIAVMEKSGDDTGISYYKCLRDYIGAVSENVDITGIREMLGAIYPSSLLERVISGMEEPRHALRNFPLLDCYNCEKCKYTEFCCFPATARIYKKLKEIYALNPIDQGSNMFLNEIYKSAQEEIQ